MFRPRQSLATQTRNQPQAFLKGKVRYDFGITRAQIERRSPFISDQLDRKQDEWGLAQGLRTLTFVPAQKTHREVKDVETLLFLGRASVREQAQQSTLECFLPKPSFEELILISRGAIDVAQAING